MIGFRFVSPQNDAFFTSLRFDADPPPQELPTHLSRGRKRILHFVFKWIPAVTRASPACDLAGRSRACDLPGKFRKRSIWPGIDKGGREKCPIPQCSMMPTVQVHPIAAIQDIQRAASHPAVAGGGGSGASRWCP